MTPGLSYAWPPKWSLCPSSLGVALVPWVAPLQTPRPRTRSLLPRTSALSQAQAGHCPSVQETGPSLPRLLKREGPPPWGEVGASGERCMAEMAVGRGCDCPQSGGRPASSHGRLKTATLERITVTVWDLSAFLMHPGSQSLSRREAKDSALLSSCDGYLLEPTEWPKGSQPRTGTLYPRRNMWLTLQGMCRFSLWCRLFP